MPVYNIEEKYLTETLNSVFAQKYKNYSLLIVNDYSTDNTFEIIKKYEKMYNSQVRVINSHGKKGIVGALNEGINTLDADCSFIARIDCGDLCHPDRLFRQVDFLEKNKDYYIIGTRFNVFCDEGQPSAGILRFQKYSNNLCTYQEIKNNFTVMAPFVHPSLMFCRELFSKVGLYSECYEAAEDYEIVGRAISSGYKVAKLPDTLVSCRFTLNKGISQLKREIQVNSSLKIKLKFIKANFLDNTNKNVIIWGSKEFAEYLSEEIQKNEENFQVKCFTDFDQKVWGSNKQGIQVIEPDKMVKKIDSDDIIITMWNLGRDHIISFLESKGLSRNINYFVFS